MPFGRDREKCPSMSVADMWLPGFTDMDAPVRGSLSAESRTLPDRVKLSAENTCTGVENAIMKSIMLRNSFIYRAYILCECKVTDPAEREKYLNFSI